MDVLKGFPARALAVLLVAQAGVYYAVASRTETTPTVGPLSAFPGSFDGWNVEREFPLEKEVAEVLKADDTVNRIYVSPSRGASVSFFIAFFKTQRYGQSPHSPKNCLPGSGWQPMEDARIPISVPGRDAPIVVNKYVIARGDQRSLVLYWYQSHKRVIAGEFAAKFWLVADAIRYGRSDTALIRVIVPIQNGSQTAEKNALDFVAAAFPHVSSQLP
jgi:EpsI family protein